MQLSKMSPDQLIAALEDATKKAERAEALARGQREADAKAAAIAAAEEQRLERETAAEEQRRAGISRAATDAAAEVEALKRTQEQMRIDALKRDVEASKAAVTLAARAQDEAEEFGMRTRFTVSGDIRSHDVRREASRLMKQVLGVTTPVELWRELEPGTTAETMYGLFGLRWVVGFTPAEPGRLYVEVPGTGNRFVPNLAELHLLITEHPGAFSQLSAAEVA